ncbi:hypothetical protein AB7C87_13725 [Natrarchaeobius sp. A-rgal3]|uniref:Uncharacterized protein n=1 Tax=Natrialba swarupiae TaxID=2448032 RepID=A0A5D5ATK7_9EURY|nr:hypothetical protein [Natrialba swarupiae]TYT63212.1 hypothetical protein FYC77_03830 [Natrialba swarupiae]
MASKTNSSSSLVREFVLVAIEILSVLPIVLSAGVVVFLSLDGGMAVLDRVFFVYVSLVWTAIGAITILVVAGVSTIRYVLDGVTVNRLVVGFLLVFIGGFLLIALAVQGYFDQSTVRGLIYAGGVLVIGSSVGVTIHVLVQAVRMLAEL